MTTRRWNRHRPLPLLCVASLVVMLLACVAGAKWSQPTRILASPDMARLAYAQVMVDVSSKSDLDRLGLDAGHGARSLSGLAVQEYFMPRTSRLFDRLDPAIRSCFGNEDRCTAVVVPLGAPQGEGLLAAHAFAPAGRMIFLLRSGRVTFKQIVEE
jgi:hypothetical protein